MKRIPDDLVGADIRYRGGPLDDTSNTWRGKHPPLLIGMGPTRGFEAGTYRLAPFEEEPGAIYLWDDGKSDKERAFDELLANSSVNGPEARAANASWRTPYMPVTIQLGPTDRITCLPGMNALLFGAHMIVLAEDKYAREAQISDLQAAHHDLALEWLGVAGAPDPATDHASDADADMKDQT